jgi:hypothetical protein
MDKNIRTVFACDEPKPFGFIEPLHCALSHCFTASLR